MEAIKFENVHFSYSRESLDPFLETGERGVFSLDGIDLQIHEGEFVAVLGHNGSGKSTLARLINGLLTPSAGKISVFGTEVKEETLFDVRRQVGIVFQNPDNQTVASIVEDDVAFGPENIGVDREEIGKRIDFALSAVGMENYRFAMPNRLSGGQKQRIAIAGVLALKPRVMILDESTAMLDPRGRKEVMDVVLRLNREEKITVLMITHFPEEAMLADRAIVMSEGKIVLQGKPQEVLSAKYNVEQYGLKLPKPLRFCQILRKHGVMIEDGLTPKAFAENFIKSIKESDEQRVETKESDGQGIDGREVKDLLGAGQTAQVKDLLGTEQTAQVKDLLGVEETAQVKDGGEIVCENLSYVYNPSSPFETHALENVSLEIPSGSFFGIMGHTGSGKSTFVQHLNGLIKLPTAEKKYKEKKKKRIQQPTNVVKLQVGAFDLTKKTTDFSALRAKVGMVFQYPEQQLFAETVYEDVVFGLKNFMPDLDEQSQKVAVKEALETVGLDYEKVKNLSPFDLSGGQKRRVAIAGVIVTKPEILVLDEPAAGLDPRGKEEIMQLLSRLRKSWCKTVVIVSHDMDEIAENCDRAAVFAGGMVLISAPTQEIFLSEKFQKEGGLELPFTAKVLQELQKMGAQISMQTSNLTNREGTALSDDEFLKNLLYYAKRQTNGWISGQTSVSASTQTSDKKTAVKGGGEYV